jgi:hypothetical protein
MGPAAPIQPDGWQTFEMSYLHQLFEGLFFCISPSLHFSPLRFRFTLPAVDTVQELCPIFGQVRFVQTLDRSGLSNFWTTTLESSFEPIAAGP